MTPEEIHTILLAESSKTGLPKFYKNDVLAHDLTILYETETQDFLWLLRTCGSHLIPLDTKYSSRSAWVSAVNSCGDEDQVRYRFHNGELHLLTREEFGKEGEK